MTRNKAKTTRFILSMIATALLSLACDSSVEVSKKQAKTAQLKTDESEEATQTPPAETISLDELEEQVSPLRLRIQQLEKELEINQELDASKAAKTEDKQFNQNLLEQKIKKLQEENQALITQLSAQEEDLKLEQQVFPLEERIQQLERELASSQELLSGKADNAEDTEFDQSLVEQKMMILREENQALTDQLAAQEEMIRQLQDDLSTMNLQHQEELAKRTTAQ